ncbi:MAG: DUF6600 domain-containing protein [Planctomycetota bacterium]
MNTRSCLMMAACLSLGALACASPPADRSQPIAPVAADAPVLPAQTMLAGTADPQAPPPGPTQEQSPTAEPKDSAQPPGSAATSAPPAQFKSALEPYGAWVWTSEFGWVWQPGDVPVGWRPYTDGYWAYGDPYGWTWVSNAPWGWACFHYGRWVFDPDHGWVWVAGDEWAPAWVAWRCSGDYIGWAPLPPHAVWRVGIGFEFTDWDPWITPSSWCFVHEVDIVQRPIHRCILNPARNVTLVNVTNNTTNLMIVNNRIVNRSVDTSQVEHAIGKPIPREQFQAFDSPEQARQAKLRANEIAIIRATRAPAKGTADLALPAKGARPPVPSQPEKLSDAQRATLLRDQAEEQSALERYQSQQRAELDEQHQRELKQPPSGAAPDVLRQRHALELQAQREQQARELQAMQRLHRLQQQGQVPRPRPRQPGRD